MVDVTTMSAGLIAPMGVYHFAIFILALLGTAVAIKYHGVIDFADADRDSGDLCNGEGSCDRRAALGAVATADMSAY